MENNKVEINEQRPGRKKRISIYDKLPGGSVQNPDDKKKKPRGKGPIDRGKPSKDGDTDDVPDGEMPIQDPSDEGTPGDDPDGTSTERPVAPPTPDGTEKKPPENTGDGQAETPTGDDKEVKIEYLKKKVEEMSLEQRILALANLLGDIDSVLYSLSAITIITPPEGSGFKNKLPTAVFHPNWPVEMPGEKSFQELCAKGMAGDLAYYQITIGDEEKEVDAEIKRMARFSPCEGSAPYGTKRVLEKYNTIAAFVYNIPPLHAAVMNSTANDDGSKKVKSFILKNIFPGNHMSLALHTLHGMMEGGVKQDKCHVLASSIFSDPALKAKTTGNYYTNESVNPMVKQWFADDVPPSAEALQNFVFDLPKGVKGLERVDNQESVVTPSTTITRESVYMSRSDIKKLIKEAFTDKVYGQYPYSHQSGDEEEPKEDYVEEWKKFCLSVVQDKTKQQAIDLAKVLIQDLELFEDVLDLAGQNQSIGSEILKKMQTNMV